MAEPVADIELEDLRQQQTGTDQDSWYDASESPPAEAEAGERRPPIRQAEAPSGDADEDASEAVSWIGGITSVAFGTWVGVAVAGGAFAVAVYFGFLSLRMQQWTTWKDFRELCRDAKMDKISTPECKKILAQPPLPPPFLKHLAQRFRDCIAFQPGCSDGANPTLSLSPRSISNRRDRGWLPFIIYLVTVSSLATLITMLNWAGIFPLESLHSAIRAGFQHPVGACVLAFLRLFLILTYEIALSLSCFSPVYAAWFWVIHRKRMDILSAASLTFIGGAFTPFYVYSTRAAVRFQREGAERTWRSDLQSVEQQIWTRPDGIHLANLGQDKSANEATSSAVATEFRAGPMRRHR